jgi:hypothetical protein
MMTEQNRANQMKLSSQRDMANDENRDLDRENDIRLEQMKMDRDSMNDAVRMQHEKDMQSQQHAIDAVKLAMQVQSQKGKK